MEIFDASQRYIEEGKPLIVLAGKEYGSGSSRDWAAKGPWMLVCQSLCHSVNHYVILSIIMSFCQSLCHDTNRYVILSVIMLLCQSLCQSLCHSVNYYVIMSIIISLCQ